MTDTKEQAKEVASTAASQGREVAGTASEGAKQVASEAGQQAGELARQASDQAQELVRRTTGQVREQASKQTERAAGGLRNLSQQVQALSEGRQDEAGAVGDYARQVRSKLDEVAGRLEEGGFEGAVDDLQRFARRRPGLFLLGSAAAGFAVGRLVRGVQAGQGSGADDASSSSARFEADLSPSSTIAPPVVDTVPPAPLAAPSTTSATAPTVPPTGAS
jgi:hypothetical protein